jgi:hypothetical protein
LQKAIVTIVVGDEYRQLWAEKALPSWERYAQRHGYEIIAFERPLDDSPLGRRPMSWQKLLVLGQERVQPFDRVLWLDADVIINDEAAPCVVEQTPAEKIGAVPDMCLLSHPALRAPFESVNRWQGSPDSLVAKVWEVNGLAAPADYYVNGGVLVFSRHHRDLLEHVYRNYSERPSSFYEQIALSFEILTRGLHHPLDPRFNALWVEYRGAAYPFVDHVPAMLPLCIAVALGNCYFLHFAGHRRDMAAFDPAIQSKSTGMVMATGFMRNMAAAWSSLADRFEGPTSNRR